MNFNYNRQLKKIEQYFNSNEKSEGNLKVGAEMEHFIVESRSLRAVSYFEEGGVEETLKMLLAAGWKGEYEHSHLLALQREGTTVTIEPGGQIEFSTNPHDSIKDLEREYCSFIREIIPILEEKQQMLLALGYQPQSSVAEIPFIPKERYRLMSTYLASKGKYAHNMMKATASLQVTIDYSSEEDYARKFRVANCLSPVITAVFENSPLFEGNVWQDSGLRSLIWANCDSQRCGIVKGALGHRFRYTDYAHFLLNTPPIFIKTEQGLQYTGEKLCRDLLDPSKPENDDLEHMLSMVFPEVRTKKYIEIRGADAVPYPLNMSWIALLKGLLYDRRNLNEINCFLSAVTEEDMALLKNQVAKAGLAARLGSFTLCEFAMMMITKAREALDQEEEHYLDPLERILTSGKNPGQITKDRLAEGKKQALRWCLLNSVVLKSEKCS